MDIKTLEINLSRVEQEGPEYMLSVARDNKINRTELAVSILSNIVNEDENPHVEMTYCGHNMFIIKSVTDLRETDLFKTAQAISSGYYYEMNKVINNYHFSLHPILLVEDFKEVIVKVLVNDIISRKNKISLKK